jgi:imidazolonepropionase-like amidohydrolase
MSPIDALKSATANDAELLGIAQKVGTLEKGKLADVIAVPGDPTSGHHGNGARVIRYEGRQNHSAGSRPERKRPKRLLHQRSPL